jgi:hypothetical protein
MKDKPDPQPADDGGDAARGSAPNIQPVLVGMALVAIIAALSIVTFWAR